ncbi:MAG: Uma2 family endonuclease [Caulobacterales bacterium]|jgi:Uma2 family endonuclease|nr:Uma2 family endonuclease [Caulobacterales bacterium]
MNAPTSFASRQTHERHRFTGEDVLAMMRAGLLQEGGKFELIDGEVIDMPAEGAQHLELRMRLSRFLSRALPDEIGLVPDGTLRLSDTFWPEPDLYLFPAHLSVEAVRGPDLLLVIELSDTTVRYDMGRKAEIYREHGVREYWVLDVVKREAHVHVRDATGEWSLKTVSFDETLKPILLGELTIRIADCERKA